MNDDKVLCGFVQGAHGLRGLLKVESLSDNPARFQPGSSMEARLPGKPARPLTVETASAHKGGLLVQFAGVDTKEAADALRGAELVVDLATALPLPEGRYYHFQLLGMRVLQNGADLGQIVDILARPANDVYVMQSKLGREVLIPALKTIVKRVDVVAGEMEVELPEGL